MPPPSVDKMMESLMMQLLSPDRNAASGPCCEKKTHKKQRRKMKKSCFRTVICLAQIVRNRGGGQGRSFDPASENMGEDEDERYCSKCGHPLQEKLDPNPCHQSELASHPLQDSKIEYINVGVQANVESMEPVAVRIKVCPCPYNSPKSQDDKLYHTASLPELSRTNPRLVDEPTLDNSASGRESWTRSIDCSNNEQHQFHPPPRGFSRSWPEQPADAASVEALALKIAKARLLEESAYWERQYAGQSLKQHEQQKTEEEPGDGLLDIYPHKSLISDEFHPGQHLPPGIPHEGDAPRPSEIQRGIPRSTYPLINSNYLDAGRCSYFGTSNPGTPSHPKQDAFDGCGSGTNDYCYSPENGPIPFGNHCENACACRCQNMPGSQPYQLREPHPGHPCQRPH